ncbi:GNAT family N-acetyltransferase [Pectobacterium parmentieri]|uniref:GNAT family N-acetyltransferase n=1 Tax=Pectobacterium parmentieri TaxID=1905730 RepID=UPI001373F789|nr:GNAT family N-acetyltransferase [Pectobacterium parmentieri]QHQ15175.1 GNAT family N-acetyltransferase [Pectobacterium parmentieri]
MLNIISIRNRPEYKEQAIHYFQRHWASKETLMLYEDCISHCINAENPLPDWYLLEKDGVIIGGAGLITNDFISRMDLYPWLCALYVEESHRGKGYAGQLIEHLAQETRRAGFSTLHLCTELFSFYERYGFHFTGMGYHPWGESSRIYTRSLKPVVS